MNQVGYAPAHCPQTRTLQLPSLQIFRTSDRRSCGPRFRYSRDPSAWCRHISLVLSQSALVLSHPPGALTVSLVLSQSALVPSHPPGALTVSAGALTASAGALTVSAGALSQPGALTVSAGALSQR